MYWYSNTESLVKDGRGGCTGIHIRNLNLRMEEEMCWYSYTQSLFKDGRGACTGIHISKQYLFKDGREDVLVFI